MKTSYLPVSQEYFDLMEIEIKKDNLRIFYFGEDSYPSLEEVSGKAQRIDKDPNNAYFIYYKNDSKVRVDRIVVFNGIPGPAYDEYDAYALAPLTCKAGYDDDDEC